MSEYQLFKKQSSYEYRLRHAVEEKKAARKKLLDEIRKRRLQNTQNRLKHQRQAYTTNAEYREYQEAINSAIHKS